MSQMNGAIGVWQGGGYGIPFKIRHWGIVFQRAKVVASSFGIVPIFALMSRPFKLPPHLKKGDKIAITVPARALPNISCLDPTLEALKQSGFEPVLGKTTKLKNSIFGGSDLVRSEELQRFLDDESIAAIWCARGGYGSVRLLEHLDWNTFSQNPKWLIGFSDITNLHLAIQSLGICSIHGEMPLRIKADWKQNESLGQLFQTLNGENVQHEWNSTPFCKEGNAQGVLVGGNLANLISHIGTPTFPDLKGKLLFLEDVGEYVYRLERMLIQLKRSGCIDELAGLVVGDFTDIEDNDDPFDKSWQEVVLNLIHGLDIPTAFGFEAGHDAHNKPLVFGKEYSLTWAERGWELK